MAYLELQGLRKRFGELGVIQFEDWPDIDQELEAMQAAAAAEAGR